MNITPLLLVALGGSIGAVLRFALGKLSHLLLKNYTIFGFPISILLINSIGCLVFGILIALNNKMNFISDNIQLFLLTGIIASFTTFSSFSYEFIQMITNQLYVNAALYLLFSIVIPLMTMAIPIVLINS